VQFYLVLFRKTYLRNFQYRMAAMVNNLGSLVFGFMYIAIWQGTLGPDRAVLGFGRDEMGWYMAFVQGIFFISFMALPRGFQIEQGVRTGSISLQMIRPINFYGYYLAHGYGYHAYNFLFRSIPVYIILSLFVGFPSFHFAHLPLLMLSLLCSSYLGFLSNYFVGIAAFWTNSTRWAFIVMFTAITTFSGFLVPLPIMPGFLATLSLYLPFAGMNYYPAMVLLGRPTLLGALLPLFWCAVLTFAALAATRAARRKLEVQGG
jgi:ABC-2 type transport system permease protein